MPPNPRSDRPDVLPRSRSVSLSNDVQPSVAGVLSPPAVEPSPAFIAASAASQIVAADLEQNGLISSADGDSALVTPGSLALLNGFLDYLLFNILAVAKSTQLSALRPAIAEVLKPRLAKEVISAADEELSEYMGGGEDEELLDFHGGQEPRGEFDLIRSWKLTRLRCMVYTRLGDLEEEEEDEYIAREGLDEAGGAPRRFASHVGNITPAAAIFLTSIIEYLGEHALVLAGENARSRSPRMGTGREGQSEAAVESNVRLVVEESDMEKLALNATLGRLWRTWRKRVKGPTLSRTLSRESFARRGIAGSRKSSITTIDGRDERDHTLARAVEEEEEHVDPVSVALPVTENDAREIEAPVDVDGEVETMQATVAQKVRPRSLMVSNTGLLTPTSPTGSSPNTIPSASDAAFSRHSRTRSLPIPPNTLPTPSSDEDSANGGESGRRPEERPSLETMYESEENETAPAQPAEASKPREVTPESASAEDTGREQRPSKVDSKDPLAEVESDHRGNDVEVIEGQGTYERPKLSNLPAQRPRRKSSRETSRRDNRSAYVIETGDSPAGIPGDHAPPMQGVDPSAPTQQTEDDRLRSSSVRAQDESISSATSHPRQLEGASALSVPPAHEGAETADGRSRNTLIASRHASSNYSDSIGAPQSTSDESEPVSRSRTPSRSTSQPPSGSGQVRHAQGDSLAGSERAAVQRIHGPSSSQPSSISKSRRSESIGSSKRPQTAGSTTSTISSKLRGLIGRHPAEGDNPLPQRARASSEASRKSSASDEIGGDDKSDLDRLIKSDETIHYTLTPRSMREIEVCLLSFFRSFFLCLENLHIKSAPPRHPGRRDGTQLELRPPSWPTSSRIRHHLEMCHCHHRSPRSSAALLPESTGCVPTRQVHPVPRRIQLISGPRVQLVNDLRPNPRCIKRVMPEWPMNPFETLPTLSGPPVHQAALKDQQIHPVEACEPIIGMPLTLWSAASDQRHRSRTRPGQRQNRRRLNRRRRLDHVCNPVPLWHQQKVILLLSSSTSSGKARRLQVVTAYPELSPLSGLPWILTILIHWI